MGPRKVTRKNTVFVLDCSSCGKEVEVQKDTEAITCYDCQTEIARAKALVDGQFLIGAEIIEIDPKDRGHLTDCFELSSLLLKTRKGIKVELSAGGHDDRYIEWEEIEEND